MALKKIIDFFNSLIKNIRNGLIIMYYNFNPRLPEPLNVIHPYQVLSVQRFLSNTFPEEIESIILYGGSLDLACGKYSDLDLYIIINGGDEFSIYEAVRELCLPLKKRFDILISNMDDFINLSKKSGTIESVIIKKSVCLYAKQKSNIVR